MSLEQHEAEDIIIHFFIILGLTNYPFNQEGQGSLAEDCMYCHVQLNILVISIKFTLTNLYRQTMLSKSLCRLLDKEKMFSSGNVTMKLFSRVKTIPDNPRRVLSSLSVQNSMNVLHLKPPVLIKISAVKTVHMRFLLPGAGFQFDSLKVRISHTNQVPTC